MSERKIEPGRYRQRTDFCLDHDGSKYVNNYSVYDREKDTGISFCDAGDSSVPKSNVRTIVFGGKEYSSLKGAIIAYEDSITTGFGT